MSIVKVFYFQQYIAFQENFVVDDSLCQNVKEKYPIETEVENLLQKYVDEITYLKQHYHSAKYLYFIDLNVLKTQPHLFKLICKYLTMMPTSSKVESAFSKFKYFIKNMPNFTIEQIRNRVRLKIDEKCVDLRVILKSWLPSDERIKLENKNKL